MRKGGLTCLAVVLAIGCSCPRQRTSSNTAIQESRSDVNSPSLRCELRSSVKSVLLSPNSRYHLHFLMFWQTSGVKVYEDWNSWGYGTRSLIGGDVKGRTYELWPRRRVFTRNYPSTVALSAGDFLITDVYPCDGSWFASPKLPPGQTATLSLTGRFRIASSADAVKHGVWTGEIQTPKPVDVYLDEDCVRALNAKDEWQ